MQIVYATHLPLPAEMGSAAIEDAMIAIASWVGRRFGVAMRPIGGGVHENDRARVEWSSMSSDSSSLFGVYVDTADTNDLGWRWRTYIDLGAEEADTWIRVRIALYSPTEGRLTSPRVISGRPGVVRELADTLPILKDGWKLGEWRPVDKEQVDSYVAFLCDPLRQLPVVTISANDAGETGADPARLADRLLGLAHVVTIDSAAAFGVTDRIGKSLSCYWGAVRVYWPGFAMGDDPYFHRLFMGGTLTYLGRDGLERELFDLLGRLAGFSLEEPSLRRRLRTANRRAELDTVLAERNEARSRLIDSVAVDAGESQAFDELVAEFTALQERHDALEFSALEAADDLEKMRQERDDAKDQLLDVIREFSKTQPSQELFDPTELPTTVVAALRAAEKAAIHTVFLPEAFSSAEQSGFPQVARVVEDLELIEEVARDWANGDLPLGPDEAFKQRSSSYLEGIGTTTATKYAVDYERQYEGDKVMLGPHLKHGTGPVALIMRIYMYFDKSNRCIVVGHVGRKLRDTTNKN